MTRTPDFDDSSWRLVAGLVVVATSVQAMAHSLKILAGASSYALRKQTEEPVFEIIKWAFGFRQCSLRVLKKVTEKWNLVCLPWHVERMAVLCSKTP